MLTLLSKHWHSTLSAVALSLATISTVHAASFNCKKASTGHERMICVSPSLSAADGDMGKAYLEALRSFPIDGFIKHDQRDWLYTYRDCKIEAKCLQIAKQRTQQLLAYKNAAVYGEPIAKKGIGEFPIIALYKINGTDYAHFLGSWMPDMKVDPNSMKGYPHDGFVCNNQVELAGEVANAYVQKGGSPAEAFSMTLTPTKLVLKGSYSCNMRTGISSGTFERLSK